tara:strand:- start:428 stop:1150 length:723 start_codon:yes stop_codon:yes gene_type:complete
MMGLAVALFLVGMRGYFIVKDQSYALGTDEDALILPISDAPTLNSMWSLDGILTMRTAERLEAIVKKHENLHGLWISSSGGSLEAVNRIIELINSNRITLFFFESSICYSACVKVLLETDRNKWLFQSSSDFLIGIHRARLGYSFYARHVLEYFNDDDFEPDMMRGWIGGHSPKVVEFLDGCPESPFDRQEVFVLTSQQFHQIAQERNDFNCGDIWNQDGEWADSMRKQWQEKYARQFPS